MSYEPTSRDASVHDRIITIVAEQVGMDRDQIEMNEPFLVYYGADSLDMVEMVMEAEEEFDITIPDDEADKIKTPADLELVVLNGGKYPG